MPTAAWQPLNHNPGTAGGLAVGASGSVQNKEIGERGRRRTVVIAERPEDRRAGDVRCLNPGERESPDRNIAVRGAAIEKVALRSAVSAGKA
jgi:hypothetical protein